MQTTINIRKEESKTGNLSVEFLCSTLDLPCAVKNVKGSVSLPTNYQYVVSTSRRPLPEKEWLKHIKSCRKSTKNDVYYFSLGK